MRISIFSILIGVLIGAWVVLNNDGADIFFQNLFSDISTWISGLQKESSQ